VTLLLILISIDVVYFTFPETMGVPLEEMDSVFGGLYTQLSFLLYSDLRPRDTQRVAEQSSREY
jgi:hypothetical protein